MQSQDRSGLPSSHKRWKTGVGQSQPVYTCLNALWAQVWASSQRWLTCLWSAGWYLWEAAFQVGRGKEKTFLCQLCPSTSAAGAACRWALAGEVSVQGGKQLAPAPDPILSLQTYLLLTVWSNKLHLPPAVSVALGVSWYSHLGTFLLTGKVQGHIMHHHPACPLLPPKKPTGLGRIRPLYVQGIIF